MNQLPLYKQILILSALVEGNSLRSISRMLNVHRKAIVKLLVDGGKRALELHDKYMVNLKSNYMQVDEIWTYVAKKQKRLTAQERYYETEIGDQYVFVALDAETKLVPVFQTGKRNIDLTRSFIKELDSRIKTPFQLSTDSFAPYYPVVKNTFREIDYAQVHKIYGEDIAQEKRYSPARITGIEKKQLIGQPDIKNISTSYVERQNLTMRMSMRRFTRLTNAYSKKLENLKHAVALHFFHYNFMRIHETLRCTPAMKAGITNTFWSWEKFLGYEENKKIAV
jgi:IS1 family transposase